MKRKIRVLTLSKPYVAPAYRQKLQIWHEDERFEVGLITPTQWAGQAFQAHEKDRYWLRNLDICWDGKNHFHFYRGLEQAIAEFKPDIFNVEEEHYSIVTWQCFRLAQKYNAKALFYTWQNIDKRYPPPFSWIEQYIFRKAALAVAGNQEAIDILRHKRYQGPAAVIPQMGADANLIQSISLGKTRFRQELQNRLSLDSRAFLAVYAGRMVEEKGLFDLVHSLKLLKDLPIHMLFLGAGPLRAQLEQLVSSFGLSKRVHFIGSVSGEEVYRYFSVADALVLPSRTKANWKEQFGRVLVEAMLSGAVPIGSDSGEIPKVIADAGLVFPEGDHVALAGCLRQLASQADLKQELVRRAELRAGTHYTNEVIAKQFADIFVGLS